MRRGSRCRPAGGIGPDCGHNEEKVIADRIANALALDYPPDRLEVVIASDGSNDETGHLVRRVADPRVRLLELPRVVEKRLC